MLVLCRSTIAVVAPTVLRFHTSNHQYVGLAPPVEDRPGQHILGAEYI
jgi:hypothetical protein